MNRGRCTQHGLAVGPDGGCVLCRREGTLPAEDASSASIPASAPATSSEAHPAGDVSAAAGPANGPASSPMSSPSSSSRMSWTTPAPEASGAPSGAPSPGASDKWPGLGARGVVSHRPPSAGPRTSSPPPKQPLVSIQPGEAGNEVVVRVPRAFVLGVVGLALAAGAFAWSRVTPDMSFFGRLLPAPPAVSAEQGASQRDPNRQLAGATEQATPQHALPAPEDTERAQAPAAAGEAAPVSDQEAVLRRMKNEIAEKNERLARARRNVSVEMYSTAWCRICKDARTYLAAAGVAYEDYDVDRDHDADRRLRSINPQHTVPTFDIDGAVLTGWSPAAFESMVTSAAGRRATRAE